MNAGILNEIIEIYQPSITIDEYGNQSTDYKLKYTTRAKVSHNSGNREVQDNEVVYIYNKEFIVRMYIEIGDFDRIKWNGKFWRVLQIEPNKEYQEIKVNTELVNE